MADRYCKRLIEVDLPIRRISAHARREKSIRHGHISTLHIWWARRPLAACRAVLCAALWPDPIDELCPESFRETAKNLMLSWARDHLKLADEESEKRWVAIQKNPRRLDDPKKLRDTLLGFLAEFAKWGNSTIPAFITTSRALTDSAHVALGGVPGSSPLVVDPFAGGGSIPLEALRVGANVFASDLNPVAVLLNKVVLEYFPKFGEKLANETGRIARRIKDLAEEELKEFYPPDSDGATAVAYLWSRTVISEEPGNEALPIEVPLLRSMWLSKKKGRKRALRWLLDSRGNIKTTPVEVTHSDGKTYRLRRPVIEVFEPLSDSEVSKGTVAAGAATCPVTGFTVPVRRVREQLRSRKGGGGDARLVCIVSQSTQGGRFFRTPTREDELAADKANQELVQHLSERIGELNLVPDEAISLNEIRRISVPLYGMMKWADLFTPRQLLVLSTMLRLLREAALDLRRKHPADFALAVQSCLALVLDRQANTLTSLSRWHTGRETVEGVFTRQAIPMLWDFAEANPWSQATGDFLGAVKWILNVCKRTSVVKGPTAVVQRFSSTEHPLSDDFADAIITDPPYYDAIPYAHLSDFFYVWLKRSLSGSFEELFQESCAPKDKEIVVDRPHRLSSSNKDVQFYESELTRAFSEARRIARPDAIGTVVFASKSTASWEALLQALHTAGWIITATWPLDTELTTKVAAIGQARLMSSIHIVCRPRADDSIRKDDIGDWREVLVQLPQRVHEWLPRLANEGIVGADAIFACLGPALEIFSKYSSVEKASGEEVELKEYLEHVWAAVAREALSMIFEGADATGFEEDARLTAMWLWTLRTNVNGEVSNGNNGKVNSVYGYTLEYDAARKIAQGLGAHLERLDHLVEVKGDKATLLSASARVQHLFGKEARMDSRSMRGKRVAQMKFDFARQTEELEQEMGGWVGEFSAGPGATVLDQLHQAMILFGASRGEAMKRLLIEDGVGRNALFWRLAQALSALYPTRSEEKRWVDGVLARKKGLGF